MKIFIVILNYNGGNNTLTCLKSLEKLYRLDNTLIEIIIIDNASTDASASVISNFQFPISNFDFRFIRNRENLGFAGGNNIGITYALQNEADYILLLNNDTIVDKNLLRELLHIAEKDKKIGIVSPKIYFEKDYEFHKDRYQESDLGKVIWYAGGVMDWENILGHHKGVDEVDDGQYDKEQEIDYATGCCMLIKKEVLKKIGFMDKNYYLYYEDNDLSQRAKHVGYKIMYAPEAIIWHKNAGSAGGSGSELQDYYLTRNRLLFGFRYAPVRSKLALIRESLRLLRSGRKWQRQGVLDFYFRRLGKGSYNIRNLKLNIKYTYKK